MTDYKKAMEILKEKIEKRIERINADSKYYYKISNINMIAIYERRLSELLGVLNILIPESIKEAQDAKKEIPTNTQ